MQTLPLNAQSILVIGMPSFEEFTKSLSISEVDRFILDIDQDIEDTSGKKGYKITQIREMLKFIHLKPLNSPKKIAIVKRAEFLNIESANALLKTLEEPPKHAVILLSTLEERKIIPTISSRCQKIRLPFSCKYQKPKSYLSPEELSKLSISERFKWVADLLETQEIEITLTIWLQEFQQRMLKGENVLGILGKISKTKDLLETNISVKLLLENLVLYF